MFWYSNSVFSPLKQGCIFWRKISIFPGERSYVTYTFLQKLWGVRNWNCHFIAVLRRNLEKNSVSYQKSLTFPKINQFLAYLSKGGGVSPNLSEYAPLPCNSPYDQCCPIFQKWVVSLYSLEPVYMHSPLINCWSFCCNESANSYKRYS